jgi:hypothetical protein
MIPSIKLFKYQSAQFFFSPPALICFRPRASSKLFNRVLLHSLIKIRPRCKYSPNSGSFSHLQSEKYATPSPPETYPLKQPKFFKFIKNIYISVRFRFIGLYLKVTVRANSILELSLRNRVNFLRA